MKNLLRTFFFFLLFSAFFPAAVFASGSWDASVKILANPSESYEGHLIEFWDDSVFHLGSAYDASSFRSAEAASDAEYIRTSWECSADEKNTIRRAGGNIIAFSAVYDSPGTDRVTLSCRGIGGGLLGQNFSDSKVINIKKCPGLESVSFEGEQRAFRRQKINVCLAQRPDHPVDRESLALEILDSSGCPVPFTKEIEISSDEQNEFLYCSMEFLTKNSENALFTYHILAEDDRGSTLETSGSFTVAKDLDPSPLISMKLRYYRSEGGGPALISAASSGRITDDPVSYEWILPEKAKDFADTDGGLGKSICFSLEKPGRYSLGLKCTDIPEDTIPEFTDDSDFKSKTYTVNFKVENIAPSVGILKTKSLELLLINSDDDSLQLESSLLDRGIVADIYPVSLDTAAQPGLLSLEGRLTGSYARDLDSNFFYNSAFSCDDNYIFRIVPAIVSRYPSPPFDIYRYSLSELSKSPVVFSVGSSYLSRHSGSNGCSLGSDLQQKYLYISIGGDSVVVDKEEGLVYGPFSSFVFGKTNIIAGGFIYSLLEDGVYRADLSDLSVSKVLGCSCLLDGEKSARLFKGKAVFIAKENDVLCRYETDLQTGTFSREEICESESDDRLIAICPSGKILINSKLSETRSLVRGWDRNLNTLFSPIEIAVCSEYKNESGIYAVYSSANEVNYVYTADEAENGAASVRLYGLYDGYEETSTGQVKTVFNRNVIALELENGTVFVGLGADVTQNKLTSYFSKHEFLTGEESESISVSFDPQLEYGFRFGENIIAVKAAGSTAYCHVYRFSEGYPDNLARISLATLPQKAEYRLATEIADPDYIADYCGGYSKNPLPEYIPPHYKTGDTVRLSDFNIRSSDYENDTPLTEHSSISFPASFDTPGEYFFDYWVSDNTGNSEFNYNSRKARLSFFVDADESEEKENVPRNIFQGTHKTYKLHRLF